MYCKCQAYILVILLQSQLFSTRTVKYPPNDREGYQELELEQEDLDPIDNPLDQPAIIDYYALEQCRRLTVSSNESNPLPEPDIMSRYTNHGCLLKCYYYDDETTVSVHPVEDGQPCYSLAHFSCRHGYCASRRHVGRLKFSILSAQLPLSEETYVEACVVRTSKLTSFPPEYARLYCRAVCQTTVAPQSTTPRWNHECLPDTRIHLSVPLNSTIILKVFNTRSKGVLLGGASISIANIFNYELNGHKIRRNITGGYIEGGVIYASVHWIPNHASPTSARFTFALTMLALVLSGRFGT